MGYKLPPISRIRTMAAATFQDIWQNSVSKYSASVERDCSESMEEHGRQQAKSNCHEETTVPTLDES